MERGPEKPTAWRRRAAKTTKRIWPPPPPPPSIAFFDERRKKNKYSLEPVPEHDHQRQAFALLVGSRRGLRGLFDVFEWGKRGRAREGFREREIDRKKAVAAAHRRLLLALIAPLCSNAERFAVRRRSFRFLFSCGDRSVLRAASSCAAGHRSFFATAKKEKKKQHHQDEEKKKVRRKKTSTYKDAAQLAQHPVLGRIEALQVLLRAARHGADARRTNGGER